MLNVGCFNPIRVFFKCVNMCNVPPKFYKVCRLCLSCPNEECDVNLSIFDEDSRDEKSENPSISHKIMTCLSILVGDSHYSYLRLIRYVLTIMKS